MSHPRVIEVNMPMYGLEPINANYQLDHGAQVPYVIGEYGDLRKHDTQLIQATFDQIWNSPQDVASPGNYDQYLDYI